MERWQKAPGSAETQFSLTALRNALQPVLNQPDLEASVCIPLASHGHWTWLAFRRPARTASQPEPSQWHAVYMDSLKVPSQRCRDYAVTAYSMASQIIGSDRLASWSLPPTQTDTVQTDSTSCGFHCIAWTEQEYRRLRGEGPFRVSGDVRQRAE